MSSVRLKATVVRTGGRVAWVQIGGCIEDVSEDEAERCVAAVAWFKKQLESKLEARRKQTPNSCTPRSGE